MAAHDGQQYASSKTSFEGEEEEITKKSLTNSANQESQDCGSEMLAFDEVSGTNAELYIAQELMFSVCIPDSTLTL